MEEMGTCSQQVVEPSAGSLLTFLALEELSAARTLGMQARGCLMTTVANPLLSSWPLSQASIASPFLPSLYAPLAGHKNLPGSDL